MSLTNGHTNFAKFAFNIYGTLSSTNSSTPQSHEITPSPSSSQSSSSRSRRAPRPAYRASTTGNRLTYQCDKETMSLSQLNYPLHVGGYGTELHSIVIGGKNYLRLLCISESQQRIIDDINLLESKSIYNSRVTSKLINVNTIKTYESTIATGLSNGVVSIYKISPNGQGRVTGKFSDHKRTINSLDFVDSENQLISGSQDGTIKLWDLRSSSSKPKITIQANLHSDPIRACQYSPHSVVRNKMCVLSVHDSGALCKFDLRSTGGGGNIYSPEKKWNLHTGPALSLHIHPEREYVVTGGRDQRISVFNFGEGQSTRSTPENTINTFGPVLKVRWGSYPNVDEPRDEFEETQRTHSKNNPLFNYDIACLYLNDDPTVAVYNLSRKYVPKQVIHSKKPIQNFIWARNSHHDRNIWTLTKSNTFYSHNLDQVDEYDVSRPLDDLNNVAIAWDNNNNFSMVNQDKFEFELDENESNDRPEGSSEVEGNGHGHAEGDEHYYNSMTTSPVEKAALARSYTHNPMLQVQLPTKSPLPVTRSATGLLNHDMLLSSVSSRPKLTRNMSQTTQESSISHGTSYPVPQSAASHGTLFLKRSSNNMKPPRTFAYVIPVTLPIPSNDEFIFKKLSSEYLVKLPDGFTLIDVCLLNASNAASVNSNRTCQVWRLLAVSLQEHFESQMAPITVEELEKQQNEQKQQQQQQQQEVSNMAVESGTDSVPGKSVLSVLGNFVESYRTNSSFGTNTHLNKPAKLTKLRTSSGGNLMDKINLASRTNSFSTTSFKLKERRQEKEEEEEKEDAKGEKHLEVEDTNNDEQSIHSNSEPIKIKPRPGKVEDLDDENLNIANSMGLKSSPTSVGISLPSSHTFSSSIASSPQPIRGQILPKQQLATSRESPVHNWLDQKKNELFSGRNVVPAISGLSLALKTSDNGDEKLLTRAWKFKSLLRKALDYAVLQGDVIFCATAAILFYEFADDTISEYEYLEWVSMYIDILQKKRLFVTAINIINSTSADIKSKLQKIYSVDLDLRFYCSNCESLLVNEKSQLLQKGEFGYWYCDECNKVQLTCVYCNEPCKGLAVVVGLKCGHQGHFGCLKEWFIQGENTECPGGCDYHIV
ncbi:Restriction of telomere capping protein 1 [Candida viswanathii]|uniref:Restriction of telomere capping protein 1 n=1 Tax=Candida viswanathii TaxID=5486 RepID=A0A367YJN9_9ASCO|nr:Restriction of telomere capping protein 1 [Candida viswanathii]